MYVCYYKCLYSRCTIMALIWHAFKKVLTYGLNRKLSDCKIVTLPKMIEIWHIHSLLILRSSFDLNIKVTQSFRWFATNQINKDMVFIYSMRKELIRPTCNLRKMVYMEYQSANILFEHWERFIYWKKLTIFITLNCIELLW